MNLDEENFKFYNWQTVRFKIGKFENSLFQLTSRKCCSFIEQHLPLYILCARRLLYTQKITFRVTNQDKADIRDYYFHSVTRIVLVDQVQKKDISIKKDPNKK